MPVTQKFCEIILTDVAFILIVVSMVTLMIYLEHNLELCSTPLTPAVEFSILDMSRLISVLHCSVSSVGIKTEYICITYFGSTPEIAK